MTKFYRNGERLIITRYQMVRIIGRGGEVEHDKEYFAVMVINRGDEMTELYTQMAPDPAARF